MRTLLIADDERNIRLGLRAMIEREYPGAYEIRMAADGRQALEEFEREPADIVLTDIRMPNLDGIELIRRLSDRPRAPAILILSGYDDFQYAKEAIKHKVKEYLLKPIVREDLFAALSGAEAELAEREKISGRLLETDQYRQSLRLNTLRHLWASADLAPDEAEKLAREAGLTEFGRGYAIGLLDFSGQERDRIKGNEYLASCGAGFGEYLALEDKDGRLAVLAADERLLTGLADALASSKGASGTFAAGLSGRGESLGLLKIKYEEAKHALKYRLLLDRSATGLIRYEQVAGRRDDYPVPAETVERLARMMGTDRDKEMKALLLELFAPEALAEAAIGYFEEVGRLLNERLFDQVFRTYGDASIEIIRMYRMAGSLYRFARIQDYIHCVQDLLFGLNEYVRNLRSAHVDQKDMARALEYIRANFARDINMATVSNHVSLNYSYFSEAFKEYAGMSFVPYLKKLRIDKAKELLETTDMKVLEVGDKVGFENSKHFSRVFREEVGVTPLEYRQARAGQPGM